MNPEGCQRRLPASQIWQPSVLQIISMYIFMKAAIGLAPASRRLPRLPSSGAACQQLPSLTYFSATVTLALTVQPRSGEWFCANDELGAFIEALSDGALFLG